MIYPDLLSPSLAAGTEAVKVQKVALPSHPRGMSLRV
jgi:hypothetical protein